MSSVTTKLASWQLCRFRDISTCHFMCPTLEQEIEIVKSHTSKVIGIPVIKLRQPYDRLIS